MTDRQTERETDLQAGTAGVLLSEDAPAGCPALLDVAGVPGAEEVDVLPGVRRPTLHEGQEVVLGLGRGLWVCRAGGGGLQQEDRVESSTSSAPTSHTETRKSSGELVEGLIN